MDIHILDFIQTLRNPALDKFFKVFSTLGDHGEIWIFIIFLVYFKRRNKSLVLFSILSLVITVIGVEFIIKPFVQRPRPFIVNPHIETLLRPGGYSFPSGHTATSIALMTMMALNDVSYKFVYITLALLMAFSRLYLYVHYPSDVIVGILLGFFIGYLMHKIMIKLKKPQQED